MTNTTIALTDPTEKWADADRSLVRRLTDLPNIGEACAKDLRLIGIDEPQQLVGKSPFEMYQDLCIRTGTRHDPCVLDVFMSVTSFMAGEPPRPWWHFTPARKEWQDANGHSSKRTG